MDDINVFSAPGEIATCRICRSEGTADEPLFHPCRCSGSIRNVHQECLVEWLSHSQKKHCELCKTPFRFTKLYDAQMPTVLPWDVFIQRAVVHLVNASLRAIRALLVVSIWMVILPWIIRWAWRWMFWFADAGWARDIYFVRLQHHLSGLENGTTIAPTALETWNRTHVTRQLHNTVAHNNETASQYLYSLAYNFLQSVGIETFANTTQYGTPYSSTRADKSILSSLSYISALTPYPAINRILLDIFEGQLITCLVILSFILVFLIREWVVQQQPVANLDLQRQQALVENEQRRQRQRVELLEEARRTLEELEQASVEMGKVLDDGASEIAESSSAEPRRPRMPNRDASSRAIRVQRLIEEADAILGPELKAATVETSSAREEIESRAIQDQRVSFIHSSVFTELPVTNAGPDAKLNIQVNGSLKGKATIVPAPHTPASPLISNEELEKRLSAITATDNSNDEPDAGGAADVQFSEIGEPSQPSSSQEVTIAQHDTSMTDVLASPSESQQTDTNTVPGPEDLDVANETPMRPEDLLRRNALEKLADWFWGDIEAPLPETGAVDDEERRVDAHNANQAPFVPMQPRAHEHRDPEVVAAAQQAGLDADQAEEAEDIEGILELIGLQGPLAGLLQTSLFCLLLVVLTVAGAVVLPYIWGKLVLSFIDSPVYFMVMIPLQVASMTADFIVDLVLFLGGWAVSITSVCAETVFAALHTLWPRFHTIHAYAVSLADFAMTEANASGERLHLMFASKVPIDPLEINAGFLGASVHSHLALKGLETEVDTILSFAGLSVRKMIETIAQGKFYDVWTGLISLLRSLPAVPAIAAEVCKRYLDSAIRLVEWIKGGDFTISTISPTLFDPELIYWSSTDRTLAVCAGYAALAFLATIYVAADVSITTSGHKTEKMVRGSLRQAGGVFKVILIISIEMLVFPFYCGLLLDLAFLPLFADATITSRLTFASTSPYVFCFVHWFVGTCYMFHFALFVGMCRKILRKGVLWFIRDPDDPTFHPVRDVLERNVMTQLKKIAFSALVYGALVILCLGGVIWGIGKVFRGIFPIYLTATEPTIEFPLDLLLYNFVTPAVIRLFRPSDSIHAVYAWWLRKCARLLRLSHFLFDDRRVDEEGHYVSKPWSSIARFLEPVKMSSAVVDLSEIDEITASGFEKDGQYVLTPCNDQYRPPKRGEAFLQVTKEDVYIANKDGTRNESFAKVYIPPFFKGRITLFMTCLWIFSAFAGLCATLMPLVLGRTMLHFVLPHVRLNDIYAYSLGAYTMGTCVLGVRSSVVHGRTIHNHLRTSGVVALLRSIRMVLTRILKVVYVYCFTFVAVPLVLGMIIEAHFMAPLHSCFMLSAAGELGISHLNPVDSSKDSTSSIVANTLQDPAQNNNDFHLHHTVHTIQNLALGILLMRIIGRSVLAGPGSRAAETLRRTIQNGKLNPDAYLATRYLILPTTLLAIMTLAVPPALALAVARCAALAGVGLSEQASILIYRFSFPVLSISILAALFVREIAKATARWRARIRDEVYLVGERLHNFGEKRPPIGSRSVMRRPLAVVTET